MNTKNLLPVMVLLTLTAPPAGAAAWNDPTRPQGAQVASPAGGAATTGAVARQGAAEARGRRRGRPDGVAARPASGRVTVSAEDVAGASGYLRCRAEGVDPNPSLREAWERFYAGCDSAVRRFAGSFRSRGVDVDDCAQEVWVDLLRKLPTFELDGTRGRFTSWLYSIVRSKAADQVRLRARRPAESLASATGGQTPAASGEADPARRAEAADDGAAIRRALAVLAARSSEQSYRVLHLRQIEGREVRDVAEALGIQPRQVWVTEHRMKRKLRDLLAKSAGSCDSQGIL